MKMGYRFALIPAMRIPQVGAWRLGRSKRRWQAVQHFDSEGCVGTASAAVQERVRTAAGKSSAGSTMRRTRMRAGAICSRCVMSDTHAEAPYSTTCRCLGNRDPSWESCRRLRFPQRTRMVLVMLASETEERVQELALC